MISDFDVMASTLGYSANPKTVIIILLSKLQFVQFTELIKTMTDGQDSNCRSLLELYQLCH